MNEISILIVYAIIVIITVIGAICSYTMALAVGIFIIGAIGYMEKIFSVELPRATRLILFSLLSVLFIFNSLYTYNKDKMANEKVLNAENSALQAREQISSLTEYGEIATYTFKGLQQSGQFLSPFTPVSKWTEGYLNVENNQYYFSCTNDAIEHYNNLIDTFPRFPFPYLALSGCLRKNNDASWRDYAIKARSILEKTTMIPLHCKEHDGWLEQINKLLDPNKINEVLIPPTK